MDETYQRPKGGRFEHPAWEQQSYETDAAFLGFECYRDLGRGRTLQVAYEHYLERRGETSQPGARARKGAKGRAAGEAIRVPRSFRAWYDETYWHQRARLYDQHEDAIKREEHEKVLRETSRRHAAEAQTHQAAILPVARSVLQSFTPEEREASEAELAKIPIAKRLTLAARSARAFLPLMQAERLARGMPDGPIPEPIPEEDPAVDERKEYRGLIHRILQDPDACDRAAWSVLDEDEETDQDPEGDRLTPSGWEAAGEMPVQGKTAAGTGIDAVVEDDVYSLVAELASPKSGKRPYMLRASGQSMMGAGIEDGDELLIEEDESPPDGTVVAALIHGEQEVTVKRLYRKGDKGDMVRLASANPDYQDILIPADEVRVQGRIIRVIHPPRS